VTGYTYIPRNPTTRTETVGINDLAVGDRISWLSAWLVVDQEFIDFLQDTDLHDSWLAARRIRPAHRDGPGPINHTTYHQPCEPRDAVTGDLWDNGARRRRKVGRRWIAASRYDLALYTTARHRKPGPAS
jgi:hypothetical protein